MSRNSTGEWKDRFTERQLERKRHVDRVGQRRTRNQLKKTVADLTDMVELLTQAQGNVIIDRLMKENDELRSKLNDYKTKMFSIQQLSSDCMDEAEAADKLASAKSSRSYKDEATIAITLKALEDYLNAFSHKLPFITNMIFYRIGRLESSTLESDALSARELIDSIMSWKLTTQHGIGFEFLLSSLGLDREPLMLTTKRVMDVVKRKDFYEIILEELNETGEYISPFAPDAVDYESVYCSEMERQRRAILLCAYEIIIRWRTLFASRLECHAQFWGLYRLFILLTFPSEENLDKTPIWMRPSKAQLTFSHPGFIDLIMWPNLRSYLLTGWQCHNIRACCVAFVRCLKLCSIDRSSITASLVLAADGSGIDLDPMYANAIRDLKNFHVKDDLVRLFPEMTWCFQPAEQDPETIVVSRMADARADSTFPVNNARVSVNDCLTPGLSSHMSQPPLNLADLDDPTSIFGFVDLRTVYPPPVQTSLFGGSDFMLETSLSNLIQNQDTVNATTEVRTQNSL
ncbi:uncharacterized protein A1O9_09926 [Exophiala aquamarina CBS 119918]|uniref:BZIP domain-containing protein n=1 Tax=Exophiala aquamarina CBS 119918 TaxID=1182545 RepID=A0A072P2Q8_9EURO|nr:uncharacterized protein A1O9_09926 [Exophiala aquamarina CBS 119918]KEF54131.1 hypothetical protein A1O9_09926 [Exophiala aquamarina CBS 119918]